MASTSTTVFDTYRGSPPEIYERYFVPVIGTPFARPVVEAARLQAGDRVLDVACGTGIVARLATEQVGGDGSVAGIDGNPAMVRAARSVPTDHEIEWREASADGLPFADESFDAVLCSLGLQFFADKVAALAEMGRVLDAGGRAALGVPGPTPPLFDVLHDVLADHLGADVAAFVHGVFSLHDETRLGELLTSAGLGGVHTESRPIALRLPPPADFLWQYLLATPLAVAATDLTADARGALEREVVDLWRPFADGDGMDVEVGLVLATAEVTS